MTPAPKTVLFLCTGNSCRSQMAEGIVNYDFAGLLQAFSAGTEPHGLNPKAIEVMVEIGIDISGHESKHIDRYVGRRFDFVISLCDDADEHCPVFLGGAERRHMPFDDPPRASGSQEDVMAVYRRVRDEIRTQLGEFFTERITLGKKKGNPADSPI